MKKILIPALALTALAVSACNYESPSERRSERIRECVASGGDPEFAVNRRGAVTQYFGCVR